MPYLISIVVAISAVFTVDFYQLLIPLQPSDLRQAGGVVSQISATLAGFLLAVLSVLATIANTRLVRNMQKTGHYRLLLHRLFIDTAIFGIAVVLGLLVTLCNPPVFLMYSLIFFALAGLILLLDVSRKLWLVLTNLHPTPSP